MIQPGDYKESHIISFLKCVPIIGSSRVTEEIAESSKDLHNREQDMAHSISATSSSVPTSSSVLTPQVQTQTNLLHTPQVDNMLVNTLMNLSDGEQTLYSSTSTQCDVTSHIDRSSQTAHSSKSVRTQTEESEKKATTALPEEFVSCLIPAPPMPLGRDFHKKQFIVNEVLCYIQNKMDTLPTDTIVKLGCDFFQYEDIKRAKKILYQTVPIDGQRLRMHKGENKAKLDIKDMILYLHMVPLMDMPIFLARDITMTPPSSCDSYDTAAILRSIETMQTQIIMLTEAQKVMSELVTSQMVVSDTKAPTTKESSRQLNSAEELSCSNFPAELRQQSNENLQKQHGAHYSVRSSIGSSLVNSSDRSMRSETNQFSRKKDSSDDSIPVLGEPLQARRKDSGSSKPQKNTPRVKNSTAKLTRSDRTCNNHPLTSLDSSMVGINKPISSCIHSSIPSTVTDISDSPFDADTSDTESSLSQCSQVSDKSTVSYVQVVSNIASPISLSPVRTRVFHAKHTTNYPTRHTSATHNEDSSQEISRQSSLHRYDEHRNTQSNPQRSSTHDTAVKGLSTAPGLRAVTNHSQKTAKSMNRTCTGVFVTRLKPHTTSSNVEAFLRQELGLSVKAEKLQTRYNTYSSFYIACSGYNRAKLIDGTVWPKGSLIKPFFS